MTLIVALLGLIFLIVVHELGHMLTAKALGVRVPEFGVGFGPPLFKKKFGQTVYSFRILLLGGFAKMAGMNDDSEGPDTYPAKAPWRRALIIFAGPFANFVAAILILAGIFMVSGIPTEFEAEVQATVPDTLAAEAGIQPGDRIVSVGGEPVGSWTEFEDAVNGKRPGEEVTLTIERGGEQRQVTGALTADPQDPDQALVGIAPTVAERTHSPLVALGVAMERIVQITVLLGGFIGQLITGDQSFYDNVSGPVGIASVTSTSVSEGFFLQLLAFISLNLAIFNLLPVLPLDGGHLLLIAIEKVIGRPVSPETMAKIAALGFVLIITLFLFATYADLSKLFTGQPLIPR